MAPSKVAPKPAAPRPPAVKTRYFKGKPGAAVADSDDSDGEDEALPLANIGRGQAAAAAANADPTIVAGGAGRVIRPEALRDVKPKIKMELGNVKIPDGGVSRPINQESSDEESEEEEEVKPAFIPKLDSSSEYETDSESESEEEAKPAFKPVFINKNARKTISAEQAAKEAEEAEKRAEEEREQRKLDSKDLAGETIRRELAEKELNNDLIPDVDDTDGLDPEAEFDAWRLRELARLLREKKAQAEADAEREEIERRRAMPEDQRLAEDMEYADATRAREKGEMGFLQKYYHKGAFHQDDDSEIFTRDYTGATVSQADMAALPSVLQVRDFGKRSRSKYTHLTAEDTSSGGWGTAHQAFGRPSDQINQSQQGCFNCGGPHMRADCPQGDMQNNPNMIDGIVIPGMENNRSFSGTCHGCGKPGHMRVNCPEKSGGSRGPRPGGTGGFGTSANNSALGSGSKWGGDEGRERRDDRSGRDRDSGRERDRDRRSSRSPRRREERDRDRGSYRDRDDRRDRDRRDRDGDRDRDRRDGDRDKDRRDRDRDRERR